MNKKVNFVNIIGSVLVIIMYVYNLIVKGKTFLLDYHINMLYIGAIIGVILLMFSFFKAIRDSIWMDIIYIVYMALFIGFNIYGGVLGKTYNLYSVFFFYPGWIKHFLICMLIINVVFFILSFRKEDEDE